MDNVKTRLLIVEYFIALNISYFRFYLNKVVGGVAAMSSISS